MTKDGIVVEILVQCSDKQVKELVFLKCAEWNPDDMLQQAQMLQVYILPLSLSLSLFCLFVFF
jgi:hypothetical protein